MLTKAVEFFRGYISLRAKGGFSERLIALCMQRNIPVWQVRDIGGGVAFFTRPRYYRELKKLAAESGCEVKITGKFGFGFLISRHREKLALIVAVAAGICFLVYTSTHIWTVNVSGNDKIFAGEILSQLENLGVKAGTRKKDIDPVSLQKELIDAFDGRIIWASLNVEGMSAEIQVRETDLASVKTKGVPCNVVAAFDGTLKSMRVYSGTPVESVKSAVREGDLLISGIVEYYSGNIRFVEAMGEITAEHTVNLDSDIKNASYRRYVETSTLYSAEIFNCTVFKRFERKSENGEKTKCRQSLSLNGVTLPFSLTKITESSFEEEKPSENLCKMYLIKKFADALEEKTKNSDVISVECDFAGKGEKMKISSKIQCVDFLGKSVPININNE